MTAKKSLLKFVLPAFGFCFCAAIGIFVYTSTSEEWFAAVGIGVGFIVFSAIGAYIDMKKQVSRVGVFRISYFQTILAHAIDYAL